jgi:hypothetical protein
MVIYNFPGKYGVRLSYASENMRLAPVIALARQLAIATNPMPAAIYEAGSAGFQIWCTSENNPGGLWTQISLDKGAFSKPCAYLASVSWKWGEGKDDERIIGLSLSTSAYALQDAGLLPKCAIRNRLADVTWAKEQTLKLFALAKIDPPPFHLEKD